MRYRLEAALGSIAHGVRTSVAAILSLVGLGPLARFSVPALVGLLALAAILGAWETAEILRSRPEVTRAALSEVAAYEGEGGSVWYQFEALVEDGSFETRADLGTFFYVARDPQDPDQGLLVRSGMNDAFFRQRVVGAEIVRDPEFIASTLESLPALPGGLSVDRDRHLVELESGGEPDAAFEPSELDEEPDGSMVLVGGRVVTPATYAACTSDDGCDGDGGEWTYLFADPAGGSAMLLRSPHPPGALPVTLQGLYQLDTFDLQPVLESDWFAAIDADVPTDRALSAGSSPPVLVEASWLPPMLAGGIALLLLASHVVGYPVFGAGPGPTPRRTLGPGERIAVELTGRLSHGARRLSVERSPGTVERLEPRDLGLRLWRYGMLPHGQSRGEAERRFAQQQAGAGERVVVSEPDQSMLVVVERNPASVDVRAGTLFRVGGSTPAVHLRQDGTDAYLAVREESERDRLAAELAAEAGARP